MVQSRDELDLTAGRGIAVREFQMKPGFGFADYLLYVDRKAIGAVEAKAHGTLTGVEAQSAKYAAGLPENLPAHTRPLPFLFETNGSVTYFTNGLDPTPRSRQVFSFPRVETLAEWLAQDQQLRGRLRTLPALDETRLWSVQVQAVRNLEASLARGDARALVQMATGSGKTFTAVNVAYRLLEFAGVKRILFLVDRGNLGKQTEDEFANFEPPDDPRKFPTLYTVQRLKTNSINPAAKVVITTIQRLYSMLKGEADFQAEDEEGSSFDSARPWQGAPPEVVYNPGIPPEFFDFIIVDECHRSIYELWSQVLLYFDAFLIGLTATPAGKTVGFFNQNLVMQYGHDEAVADGVNVDFDVYRIRTQVTEPPYSRAPIVPAELGWKTLLTLDGPALEVQYQKILDRLGARAGMLGVIFKNARCEIRNPALLKQLIVNLIDKEDWTSLPVDVKGVIYEELLQRSAAESTKGAGQYFTTRAVIQAICDVMQPTPADRICDPAAGTGGFLFNAYQHVLDRFGGELDADQKRALQTDLVEGMEISTKVGRMCAMNLYLHGIGGESKVVVHTGHDSLLAPWADEFSMVLTNPPFGKSQSVLFVNEEGELDKEEAQVFREDFWTSTSNKQLNFVQHIFTLLRIDGRAGVVVPDNVLFEGGAGEKVRRNLLQKCRVHTLLRLPTGIWYSPGVKANVIFFDKKEGRAEPWTDRLWVYDLRTNMHFTLKQSPIQRKDFDDFVACSKPGRLHERADTWSESNPEGRWRSYAYEELVKRDKLSLDLFWIRDKSLTDTDSLPPPDVLATEIADDLEAALEQFTKIAARLRATGVGKAGP